MCDDDGDGGVTEVDDDHLRCTIHGDIGSSSLCPCWEQMGVIGVLDDDDVDEAVVEYSTRFDGYGDHPSWFVWRDDCPAVLTNRQSALVDSLRRHLAAQGAGKTGDEALTCSDDTVTRGDEPATTGDDPAPYARGGIVTSSSPLRFPALHPDECVIRADDAANGRWVCRRPDHHH